MKKHKFGILSIDRDGVPLVTPAPSLRVAEEFVIKMREFFSEDCKFYVIVEEAKL